MKRLVYCFLFLTVLSNGAFASVDSISVFSKSMSKNIQCIVITPSEYLKTDIRFPVVYLLHGARGNFSNWATKVPDMQELADINQVLIVCPDGATNSWYFDSPIDSSFRYETHIAKELPVYIDANFRTIADRQHRAITGLSMGGHGALFIAFRHAAIFGACGSMSGALDIRMIPRSYGIDKVLGDVKTNTAYYLDWSMSSIVEKYPADSLAIIMDCGAQDFISYMTKGLHAKMVKLKIPHDYTERPGRHDWLYWSRAVRYQLLFFKEYFREDVEGVELPSFK